MQIKITEEELVASRGKIVLVRLLPTMALQMVKGRLDDWTDKTLKLVGDDDVATPGDGPDDESPSFYTVTRLGTGETHTIEFATIEQWRWQQ